MIRITVTGLVAQATKGKIRTHLQAAQRVIDSEVLRRSEPLVPFKVGTLRRSGITGTRIGSGIVRYTAPYAKHQYYNGRRVAGQQPGRLWFRRMKLLYGDAIWDAAQKVLPWRK